MMYKLSEEDVAHYRNIRREREEKERVLAKKAVDTSTSWRRARGIGPMPTPVSRDARRIETMAAINSANGDRYAAAALLGVHYNTLMARVKDCGMSGWLNRKWPADASRWSEVVDISYEGTGRARMRVYSVRCGVEIHVKRVPAVGIERKRVVCTVCKESRTT